MDVNVLQAIATLREAGLLPEAEADRMLRRARAEAILANARAAASEVLPEGWTIASILIEDDKGRIYGERPPKPSRPRERVEGEGEGNGRKGTDPELAAFAKQYAAERGLKWFGTRALMKTAAFREAARAAGFNV